jgi:hypothetical protein
MSPRRSLLASVTDALLDAGLPVADTRSNLGGAVVADRVHGVTVSWTGGTRDAAVESGAAVAVTHGGASVHSRNFRLTLRIAALLADAGYDCEHAGDRVLVGHPAA